MAERRGHGREAQASSLPRFGYSSRSPSFSSSLLDAVYRSIDLGEEELALRGETVKMKERRLPGGGIRGVEKEQGSLQRASVIEKWIQEKSIQGNIGDRRKPGGVYYCGNAVSEKDVFQGPRPVRTAVEKSKSKIKGGDEIEGGENKRGGGGFSKTKSRATKIYCELKKVKQPISPGGKLVEILNSLFAGNQKKHKIGADTHSGNTSTCSSASSFSRSINTTQTPSSAAAKRSVKFSSANEYISRNPIRTTIRNAIDAELTTESSTDPKTRNDSYTKGNHNPTLDEDDGASCASSDLFELENLSAIGIIEKHRESGEDDELPVYETTNLRTNGAIAQGLIL